MAIPPAMGPEAGGTSTGAGDDGKGLMPDEINRSSMGSAERVLD